MSTNQRELSIDDAIIEGAIKGLSAENISMNLGGAVSPPAVVKRMRELLRGADWLTEREQEKLMLLTLRNRVTQLQNQHDLDSIKVQFSIIKELLAQIERRAKSIDVDLNTYNANVGRQLGRVVDLALGYMAGALSEHVSPEKWAQLKEDALLMASVEIEKHQVEAPL